MALLAERLRPSRPEDLVGPAKKIWNRDCETWLHKHKFHAIFWGTPGSGKTTIAKLIGEKSGLKFISLSAVRDGVKEIRSQAESNPGQLLFIDEVHRLTKSQQDVLLPILENEEVWVMGATTESPQVSLNPAILSRVRTIYVGAPSESDLQLALEKGLSTLAIENLAKNSHLTSLIPRVAKIAGGDVRYGLNLLESLSQCATAEEEEDILTHFPNAYSDKVHYDFASAMIKSLRGSDPDAALFYAFNGLDNGEDPLFILRRLIVFASEDVGNADPQALAIAVNAYHAFKAVGLPEGRIPLAQAITYLASTVKSNRSYIAISKVRAWRDTQAPLRSQLPPQELTLKGSDKYKYPHDFPQQFVPFEYLPPAIALERDKTGPAYQPSQSGFEIKFLERLSRLWNEFRKKT